MRRPPAASMNGNSFGAPAACGSKRASHSSVLRHHQPNLAIRMTDQRPDLLILVACHRGAAGRPPVIVLGDRFVDMSSIPRAPDAVALPASLISRSLKLEELPRANFEIDKVRVGETWRHGAPQAAFLTFTGTEATTGHNIHLTSVSSRDFRQSTNVTSNRLARSNCLIPKNGAAEFFLLVHPRHRKADVRD